MPTALRNETIWLEVDMATRTKKRRSSKKARGGLSIVHIVVVAGVALLIVGLLVILNTNRPTATASDLAYETGVTAEGEPYKGSPDAPIRLEEYSDFLCAHCGNFADALESLGPEYIETGQVQVIFRNYAFLAPESIQAAQASECALDQGSDQFWLYHDLLFANRGTGLAAYSKPRLESYAREIGLDVEAFNECLESGAKLEELEADKAEGESKGVEATPTWFVNGQMVRGGIPESELRQILDGLLSQVP
jgi:protein-disulfide isomerase